MLTVIPEAGLSGRQSVRYDRLRRAAPGCAGVNRKPWYAMLPWLLAGWLVCGAAVAADIKVAFLAPDPAGTSPHWDRAIRIARAAAEDLQIDLQVAYSKTNTYTNRKDGLALLTADEKPDYFVTGYWSGSTEHLLDSAERLGVRTFIITSAVGPDDRDTVGEPRGKYRQWLGQMTPDDRRGGYELAERLIDKAAAARSGDKAVRVVALEGFGDTSADTARSGGLQAYIDERQNAVLDQTILAEWSRETAYRAVKDRLASDDSLPVIWSASDAMALGAVEAVRETDKQPGEDVFIGGFDWSAGGLEAVASGAMETTLGGHFLEAAWALVLLHDYHNGEDFAADLGVEFQTPLRAVSRTDAKIYLDILDQPDWSAVDFKQFSKVHNSGLETYRWPIEEVLEQLR